MYYIDNDFRKYLNEISKFPVLAEEELRDNFKRYANNDYDAKLKIIESNLILVIPIAIKYSKMCKTLTSFDIVQEGNIGLIKAVNTFDINKSNKFSTYANSVIRNHIIQCMYNNDSSIKYPNYIQRQALKLNLIRENLKKLLNRDPNSKEIAEYLKVDEKKLDKIYDSIKDTISINTTVSENKDTEIQDFISNDNLNNPECIYFLKNMKSLIYELINNSNLNSNEKEVIFLRYGFVTDKILTLEQIGKIKKITRQRVKEIEQTALKKLRKTNDKNKIFVKEDIN